MAGKPAIFTVIADEYAKEPDSYLKPAIPYTLSVSRTQLSFVPKSCLACAKSYTVNLEQVEKCYKIVNAPQVLSLGMGMVGNDDQPSGYSHKLWVVGGDEVTLACFDKIESMRYLLRGEVLIAGYINPFDKSINFYPPDTAKRLFKQTENLQYKAQGETVDEYLPLVDKTVKLTREKYGIAMITLDSSLATEDSPDPVECSVFCEKVSSFILTLNICTEMEGGKAIFKLPPKDKQLQDITSVPLSTELEPATILAAPYTAGLVVPKAQRPRTTSANGGRTMFGSASKPAKAEKPEGEATGGIMSKIKRGTSIKKAEAPAAEPDATAPTEAKAA